MTMVSTRKIQEEIFTISGLYPLAALFIPHNRLHHFKLRQDSNSMQNFIKFLTTVPDNNSGQTEKQTDGWSVFQTTLTLWFQN